MAGVRRWAGLCALTAAVTLAVGVSPASAFSTTNKARVLYVGDSIAVETQNVVAWWIQATGKANVTVNAKGGMALCDYLRQNTNSFVPAADKLYERVRTLKPHLVVLQFWGNSWGFTPCTNGAARGTEAFYNLYFWNTLDADQQIAQAASAAGIAKPKVLWVRQGPDKANRAVPQRLNSGYDFAASSYGGRTADAGYEVSMAAYPYDNQVKDRYAWTQFLPCTAFERQVGYCTHPQAYGGVAQLHKDSDPLHFCLDAAPSGACASISPGVTRYGMRIAHDANAWLGI